MTDLEIKSYDFFVDREKGRPCLVAGNAPTIKDFPYKDFSGVYILVGSGPKILEGMAIAHYWVNANYLYPVPQKHLNEINRMKETTFVFADSVAYAVGNKYDHRFLKERMQIPWFAFDERHFGHKKCTPNHPCCQLVDRYPERTTVQEFLEAHFGVTGLYRGVGTSVLHSLAFAILMGCDPIYIQGVELPLLAKDYSYHRTFCDLWSIYMMLRMMKSKVIECFTGRSRQSDFASGIDMTLAGFEGLVRLAQQSGRRVYNLSSTSALNRIVILPYLNPKDVASVGKGHS